METAFIASGHGYDKSERVERCTAFDGFTIIAAPLGGFDEASRESRSFPRRDGSPGVTYASHAIKLAKREGETIGGRGDLYILMHNGSGREVLRLPSFYDGGALERTIYHMDERAQYALLYTIWQAAANARREAERLTAVKWRDAYLDGRIRKSRPKGGYFRVTIESEFDRDLRLGKSRPERIAINVGTGEATPA